MTRKNSRKTTIKGRKPRKNQRSRKPVKNKIKPVKNKIKPVKRSRKPVKRSRKPVKRSRKPVKNKIKPVKRSRKPRRKASRKKFRARYKRRGKRGMGKVGGRKHSTRLKKKELEKKEMKKLETQEMERRLKKTAKDILQRKKYLKLGEMNVVGRYYNHFYDYLTGTSEIPRAEINSLAAKLASEKIEEERQKRERQEMAQYPSDPDDSEYDNDSGDDSDDDSDDDSELKVVEVQDSPTSAENEIGAGHYKIDTRNAINPIRFTDTLGILEKFGFFFTRALGAGASGSAGLYDFIPRTIEDRAIYDKERSQFPPLNPSESAVVTVKILNDREDTDKEIAINKHLMGICNGGEFRNYFGGTIPCPFLISSELPFVSKPDWSRGKGNRPGYKFQWSEAMNMNLRSYCDAYIWKQLDSGRYPFLIVTKIMLQLTSGMIDLHRAGVPHVDFKPDQCLLKFKDIDLNDVSKVLIADFGHSGLSSYTTGEWAYRPAKSGGAYGYRPLSNNLNFGRPINYFHNDVFALGVTFSRLLDSIEIADLAFLYNAQEYRGMNIPDPKLEDIAKKMRSQNTDPNVLLRLGNESLGRRISRCLDGIPFGEQRNKVREIYDNVLQLLLLGYETDSCLQECLKLLTTLIK